MSTNDNNNDNDNTNDTNNNPPGATLNRAWMPARMHLIESLEAEVQRELSGQERTLLEIAFNAGAEWGLGEGLKAVRELRRERL